MLRKSIFSIIFVSAIFSVQAQIGIGTNNPDASSVLDVVATDKGLLIPRVNLINITNTVNPINAPATGLLVWNANAAVTGGNGVGFYFFNGTQWVPVQQLGSIDVDFYEEGTTSPPDNIGDDKFTFGNIAIGKNTADYPLDVNTVDALNTLRLYNANTTGITTGIFNEVIGNNSSSQRAIYNLLGGNGSGSQFGGYNLFSGNGGGAVTGYYNVLNNTNGSTQYGLHNSFGGVAFDRRGVYNNFGQGDSAFRYGVYNEFDSSSSLSPTDYGVYTIMTGNSNSNQYGIHQSNFNTGLGTHYGLLNQLQSGGGNKFGIVNDINVATGVNATGQQNNIAASNSAAVLGNENIFLGTASNMSGMSNDFSSSEAVTAIGVENAFSNTNVNGSTNFALYNTFDNNSVGDQYGTYNQITATPGQVYGIYNNVVGGLQDFHGLYNYVISSSAASKYGVQNYFDPNAGGTHYGIYSDVRKAGSFSGYFLGAVSIGTTTANNYILPATRGTADQIMQTDAAGNVDWVDKDTNSFSIVRSNLSANQILNTTGWQKIRFNTTLFDTNSEFNTANNRFVASNAGYYKISAGFHTPFQNNNQYYGIAIYVNNVLYQESSFNHHAVGDVARSVDCIVALNANDYVEVFVQNFQANDGSNGANGVELDSFSGKTYFEIQRIR